MPVVRRKRVVRRPRKVMMGRGFGDFIAGLGGGVGKGINNLLGGLFGGARKRRRRVVKKRMTGRGDTPGFSLGNLNKALKDSKAISSLLNNASLGGIANTAGTVADALGYGRRRPRKAIKTRPAGSVVMLKPKIVRMRGAGVNYLMGRPQMATFATTLGGSNGNLSF